MIGLARFCAACARWNGVAPRRTGASLGTAALVISYCLSVFAGAAGTGVPSSQVGLGKVLTTQDGGQIYGFDINQNGEDGVLASAQDVGGGGVLVSVETFDQNTGAITKSFKIQTGTVNEYSVVGIFAGDVALITHYVTPRGGLYPKRYYDVMNPVTAEQFTGTWKPPLMDMDVPMAGVNQSTSTSVLFTLDLQHQDQPYLVVSDIAADTVSKVIRLDPALFGGADAPLLGQFTAANQAVIALSPDAGTVGGHAPLNVLVDLASGAMTQFTGYNNGYYHAGYVNGLAVDPNTGIAATTTELNSQVEFYNLNQKAGIAAVQLPCTTDVDQTNSGSGIAVDPINKLFLVTDTYYCDGSQGSAIVVYDETGKLVETITGFHFAIGEPPPVVNPGKRMGWAFAGPGGFNQLQQFLY